MNNQCPSCGKENSAQARYCISCGAKLEKSQAATDIGSQNPAPQRDASSAFANQIIKENSLKDGKIQDSYDVRGRSSSSSTDNDDHHTPPPRSNHTLTVVLITVMVIVVIAAAVVVTFAIRGKDRGNEIGEDQAEISESDEKSKQLDNAESYYVTRAVSYLSMRSEADSKSSIVGELYNGNSVKVLSKSGDYWYVYSEDLKPMAMWTVLI